eukprot:5800578-Pleurochrysis_carterae.AAC.1
MSEIAFCLRSINNCSGSAPIRCAWLATRELDMDGGQAAAALRPRPGQCDRPRWVRDSLTQPCAEK